MASCQSCMTELSEAASQNGWLDEKKVVLEVLSRQDSSRARACYDHSLSRTIRTVTLLTA
eukprot:5676882-Amphidinium_carterae.2